MVVSKNAVISSNLRHERKYETLVDRGRMLLTATVVSVTAVERCGAHAWCPHRVWTFAGLVGLVEIRNETPSS